MMIHRTAIVHPEAQLEVDVQIGAYSVIGPGVSIGRGTTIADHVVIDRNTRIGEDCRLYPNCVIGSDPQDLSYKGGLSYLEIGDRNVIREFVTINRGCHGEAVTKVGSDGLFMTGVHIAHDCQVGDRVILSNLATIAGHVTIADRVVVGGLAAFHQFVRIGRQAMIGGTAGVMQDVPPFCMVQGAPPATVRGLNSIGLKRSGVDTESMNALKQAYRLMFRRGMTKDNALAEIEDSVTKTEQVKQFYEFIKTPSKRGICKSDAKVQNQLKVMAGADGKELPPELSRQVREEVQRLLREQQSDDNSELPDVG